MTQTTQNVPKLLPLTQAIMQMHADCAVIKDYEQVPIIAAYDRVLAEPIISQVNVPPADNSAMDGFAFNVDTYASAGSQFKIVGSALAGRPFMDTIKAGECVRITTGAILPKNTNTVMMQENITLQDKTITLNQDVSAGNSIRLAGEDISIRQTVLQQGEHLNPAKMALLASIGIASVSVVRKIKVAIIVTGDELIEPGNHLNSGQIYESNRYALHGLLCRQTAEIQHFGIVEDSPQKIREILLQASQSADLILTCGGVSVGDADYVKQVLSEIGQINFWKVAIKPGKPFAFGKIGNALFCGLPGNPVSSYVTFEKLVIPLLEKMQSRLPKPAFELLARCAVDIFKRPGRQDFQRGIAYQDEQGQLWVKPNGKQGSGVMTSIAGANCYILLEQQQGNIPTGSHVKIQLF
jgi:molybdopterin molybdotransferase